MKFAVFTTALIMSQSVATAGQLDVLDTASLFSGVFSRLPVNVETGASSLNVPPSAGISINTTEETSSQNLNFNQDGKTQKGFNTSPLTAQIRKLTQNPTDFKRAFSLASPQKKEAIIYLLTELKNNKFSSNAEKTVCNKLLTLLGV